MSQSPRTLRDVPREADVAVGTVSRVLNGSSAVSPATAERVHAVMDRLGYVPPEAGRALRRGASRVIGGLVPTIPNPIFARSTEGRETVLRGRGCAALLMSTRYDADAEASAIAKLVSRGVDGLIATLARAEPSMPMRVPTILLDNRPGADSAPSGLATMDSRGAVRRATRRIIAQGHRRIAFLGGYFAASDRPAARAEGYRAAMIEGAPARRIAMPIEFLDGGTLARPSEVAAPLRAGTAPTPHPAIRTDRIDP